MKRIVVIVFLLWPAAVTAQQDDPDELYRQAVEAFRAGEFARSAEIYGKLHSLSPDPLLLYNRAYALGRSGQYDAAVEAAALADLGGLEGSHRAKNRARIIAYRARLASHDVAARLDPSGTETDLAARNDRGQKPKGGPWIPLGIGALGVAAVAATATAVLDAQIATLAGERDDALRSNDAESASELLGRIETRQSIARPLFVTGVVGALAGATFLVIHYSTARGGRDGPEISVGAGRAALTFRF